jgi:hypothetical protein
VSESSFFDVEKITDAVERANAKALQAGGAYMRRVAINSIKVASGPNDHAAPGRPVKDHFGAGTRIAARALRKQGVKPPSLRGASLGVRNIQFDLSDSGQHLIFGMIGGGNDYSGGKTVPGVIEVGGAVVNAKQKKGLFAGKRLTYAPHPVTTPAYETAVKTGKLQGFWKDTVK